MRFYDFMTLVWAVVWAVLAGLFTFLLADGNTRGPHQGKAIALGAISTVGMAVCVVFWRMFKEKG